RGVRGEQGRQAQPGAPEAEADATAKILVNQSLSDATYLLVHCYPSNGCVVVHAAKFWRKSSGDNTLTATASFTRFGSSGHFATLLLLMRWETTSLPGRRRWPWRGAGCRRNDRAVGNPQVATLALSALLCSALVSDDHVRAGQ